MKEIFLVYPHQLFEDIALLKEKKVLLIQEPLFISQYRFHLQKLVLHRASMKFYEAYLVREGIEVEYCEDESYIQTYKNHKISLYDVVDDWLFKKIKSNFDIVRVYPNPNFLNKEDKSQFLHHFYIKRRKELGILIENGKPKGGKWSLDTHNRKKLPKNHKPPASLGFENKYIKEAKQYCQRFESVGECEEFFYPITFEEARLNLEYFVNEKFEYYGDYQDALDSSEHFLYHSNISSSLNIGLLSLKTVIETITKVNAPLNAKEGFIRQIIGWREFMLGIYKKSHATMRTSNFFGFERALPSKILQGKSGLMPVDDVMHKLHHTGYLHHIERLMILGNIFVLLEIAPDNVYEFFMAYFIDAYDWVMVGNVYGMSGFSDGGSITTKPYISSSNYIIKMSNEYKKSQAWTKIWDGLYWRFLYYHGHKFAQNPRMKMQLSMLKKMDQHKLQSHLSIAKEYMQDIQS